MESRNVPDVVAILDAVSRLGTDTANSRRGVGEEEEANMSRYLECPLDVLDHVEHRRRIIDVQPISIAALGDKTSEPLGESFQFGGGQGGICDVVPKVRDEDVHPRLVLSDGVTADFHPTSTVVAHQ